MINFKCSECGKDVRIAEEAAGKKGPCPECGAILQIPESEMVIIEAADGGPTSQPAPPGIGRQVHGIESPRVAQHGKHRLWLGLLILAAFIAAPFVPRFPHWFGIVLLVISAGVLIPGLRGISRRLLRVDPSKKWRSGFRLAMYSFVGLLLILSGWVGAEVKATQERNAAEQKAEKAERQRMADEANARVIALVAEAEAALNDGELALAEEKLKSSSKIPHATNQIPIRHFRPRLANAKVESLVADATDALKAADIDTSRDKVQAALEVPHATALALGEAGKLDRQIGNATEPALTRIALMELPDDAFRQLQESGVLPEQLVSGYEALDGRTADLAKPLLAEVAAARKKRRLERLERERAAAEAARKTEEERKARELAAAEAKRKEEREKRIEKHFSAWDGSHRGLTKVIKDSMNDPKSYDHVETVYSDRGDHLIVKTTFRGKNAFGGVVKNWIKAKVDLNGNVLVVIEQGQ